MIRFTLILLLFTVNVSGQEKIFLGLKGELPYITIYKPEMKVKNAAAVIICPGGAYAFRSSDGEGHLPAKKLAAEGITGIVLDYRLPVHGDTLGDYATTFGDLQRAIYYVRKHSGELNISPSGIGVMGFSAGGHLCSVIGTHFNTDYTGEMKGQNLRPDFMILAYPVISMTDSITHEWSRKNILGNHPTPEKIKEFSGESQVTDSTPPTFITHAMTDDGVIVANSLYFLAALQQHRVPTEIFLYEFGGHAYGIQNKTAKVQWIDACIEWITKIKN